MLSKKKRNVTKFYSKLFLNHTNFNKFYNTYDTSCHKNKLSLVIIILKPLAIFYILLKFSFENW